MDGTSVANCEELKMPNAKKQRPKQRDSLRAHRVDKGRRINRFRAINLAKGREALALKRAAAPHYGYKFKILLCLSRKASEYIIYSVFREDRYKYVI